MTQPDFINPEQPSKDLLDLAKQIKEKVSFFEKRLLNMQRFIQQLMLQKDDANTIDLEALKTNFDQFLKKFQLLRVEFDDIESRCVAEIAELLQMASFFITGVSAWIVSLPVVLKKHALIGELAQDFLTENKAHYETLKPKSNLNKPTKKRPGS